LLNVMGTLSDSMEKCSKPPRFNARAVGPWHRTKDEGFVLETLPGIYEV